MNPYLPKFFKSPKVILGLTLIVLALGSCTTAQLVSDSGFPAHQDSSIEKICLSPFVQNKVQFIHSLHVSLPGSNSSKVLGVTNINPENESFESIIMSLEGLVLFHVDFRDGKNEIKKSVDPFSSKAFQDGLIKDIQLIFLVPDGKLAKAGRIGDDTDSAACRYRSANDNLIDIAVLPNQGWSIKKYGATGKLIKSIQAIENSRLHGESQWQYPNRVILKGEGLFGYSLTMDLIEFNDLEESIP